MSGRTQRLIFYSSLLGGWFLLAYFKFWPPHMFPPPKTVLWTLGRGFYVERRFGTAIAISLRRIVLGYGFSMIIGITLGILTARIKSVENTVGSLLIGLQTLPSICWLPAALLWFGISDAAILFVVVMGAVMAISIGTHDAVKNLPPIYIRAGMTMGVKGFRLYRTIIFPAALPGIVTALKQGWTFAWRSLMSGELLFENPGLGHLLQKARAVSDMSQVVAVMIIIMALGWSVDRFIFSALEKRLRRQRGMAL